MPDTRKSFLLYYDQGDQVELLSNEEAGKLLKSLFKYASRGEATKFENGMTQMCFSFISAQIARDAKHYEEKCKRLSENAKKTIAAKRQQLQATDSNCLHLPAIAGYKDTEKDIDTDIDTDIDIDTEIDRGKGRDKDTDTGTAAKVPVGSAPFPSPAPAPRLSDAERDILFAKGIPQAYIHERIDRAMSYAAQHGSTVYEVLLSWWKDDRAKPQWNRSPQKSHTGSFGTGSFDTDDFFQAALNRTFREMELDPIDR